MAKLSTRKDDEGKPLIEVFADDMPAEGIAIEAAAGEPSDEEFVDDSPEEFDLDTSDMVEDEEKLVPIRPRKTVLHTRIGVQWYNFIEGREIMVPISVRDWLYEKKVL